MGTKNSQFELRFYLRGAYYSVVSFVSTKHTGGKVPNLRDRRGKLLWGASCHNQTGSWFQFFGPLNSI